MARGIGFCLTALRRHQRIEPDDPLAAGRCGDHLGDDI
jgi:hypothetical protein